MFLHVVASEEMRHRRRSKRGNHAALGKMAMIMAKCYEIATSLSLAVRVAAPNLFGAELLKNIPKQVWECHPIAHNYAL